MKHTNISASLALVMSFELIVAPLFPMGSAFADNTKPPKKKDKEDSVWTADNVSQGIKQASNLWSTVNGIRNGGGNQQGGMPSHLSADMQELGAQQMGQPDKFFNSQKLMQIPGLGNYLALNNINPAMLNCETLKTTLHEAKPEVCRLGVTQDSANGPQSAQLQQMSMYHDQYFKISKKYNNFLSDSNAEGQAFGVGCMRNAMNILNGFFKYRVDELDKLTTNLEAMQNQFREASRADLDAIEETVAVLDGDSPMADKVRSKKPDLFDFGKRFNNPACNSMFTGEAINEKGRAEGLNKINQDLKKTLSTKTGKFSGESYAKSHTAVLEDINGLADRVSKQMELNFGVLSKDPNSYGKFLSELPEMVSSPNGTNQSLSPDLFSDVRTKFNETYIKLNEQKGTIQSELSSAGVSPEAATVLLGNPAAQNFENEVATIENKVKDNCFRKSFNVDTVLGKIYDPTASGHANKFASNFLKDKLKEIIENDETTLEKKLADLEALDKQNGGRYYMKMENSYEVQEVDNEGNLKTKIVGASQVRTPSLFFGDVIKNCNSQFKANKLNNKMTGAGAIQKLKQLNQDFKTLAKDQALDIKKELRKKLIECANPQEANNSTPGSCTPDRFNTSAPGFCANAALSCSKNMQACAQQADTFVKEIKAQKTARVNNYKALVEKNKQDVVKMFDSALSRYMKDAEMMRGMFGAGFSSPKGIKREVPEGERYLTEFTESTSKSIDGRLLLENPEKYTDMFKENIEQLKESVKKQQDQILGGESVGNNNGLLADHVKKTESNFKAVASQSKSIAEQCIGQYDRAVDTANKQLAEQQKKYTEFGEKRDDMCRRFRLAESGHPVSACKGDLTEISKVVGGAANDLETFCDETQNSDNAQEEASMICQGRGPVPKTEEPRKVITENSDEVQKDADYIKINQDIKDLEKKIKDYNKNISREEDKTKKYEFEDSRDEIQELLDDKKEEKPKKINEIVKKYQDKQDKEDANKKPVDSNSTADASSTRVSEGSALDSACKSYNDCINKKNSKSPEEVDGKTVWVKGECVQLNALAKLVVKAANNRSIGTTPAMCNAANNSGRENSPKGWMGAMDTFNQELRARTQGQ